MIIGRHEQAAMNGTKVVELDEAINSTTTLASANGAAEEQELGVNISAMDPKTVRVGATKRAQVCIGLGILTKRSSEPSAIPSRMGL